VTVGERCLQPRLLESTSCALLWPSRGRCRRRLCRRKVPQQQNLDQNVSQFNTLGVFSLVLTSISVLVDVPQRRQRLPKSRPGLEPVDNVTLFKFSLKLYRTTPPLKLHRTQTLPLWW
jgi:hypothetical protein